MHLPCAGRACRAFAGLTMYMTPEELLSFLPGQSVIELTNDDPRGTEPDMDKVEEALRAAEELVDGYLRGRYELPLSTVPTLLRDVVRVIARFKLYERRPESDMPETVMETYKAAVKTLEQIRSGRITLGIAATAEAMPERGEHRMSAPKTFFSDAMRTAYERS
ncbi:gp436 family protein [Bilophila wadsworthia]